MSKMLTKYPNGSFHVGKMVRIFSFALGWVGKRVKWELAALRQVRGLLTHRPRPCGGVDHPILWVYGLSLAIRGGCESQMGLL